MTERVLVAGVDSSTQSTKVVVCDAATGEIVSTGAASAVMASTRRSADTIAVADFEFRNVS